MKNLIISLLAKGFVKTKRTLDELCKNYYFIERIAEFDERTGTIRCNANKFWNCENNNNRTELMNDIDKSGRGFEGKFEIFNRYNNGDKYGIA